VCETGSVFVYICFLTGYLVVIQFRGRCSRDRMVVGLTTTCAINAYHH